MNITEQLKKFDEKQYLNFEVKGTEKLKDERAIIHWITTPDIDLTRDIVNPKGGDFGEFDKHKTVFYNHNYNLPIAKNITLKATEDGVRAKTVFAKTTQFADDIYNLHVEGIISTWSIGFDIARDKSGHIEKDAVEYDEKRNLFHINKWRLLEYSSAPLAANPNALDTAKTMVKSIEAYKELLGIEEKKEITEQVDYSKEFTEIKELINSIKEVSENEVKKINLELTNLKSKLANKTVKTVVIDRQKLIDEAVGRELSRVTGRKVKI